MIGLSKEKVYSPLHLICMDFVSMFGSLSQNAWPHLDFDVWKTPAREMLMLVTHPLVEQLQNNL